MARGAGASSGSRTVSAHGAPHMSPAQAAEAAGVSRWAVLRAIKAQKLNANRDNRNNWRIAPDDLAGWCAAHGAHMVRDGATAPSSELVADLREKLAAVTVRAEAAERARDQAEAERDHWRAMAERLAARRRWWPFG